MQARVVRINACLTLHVCPGGVPRELAVACAALPRQGFAGIDAGIDFWERVVTGEQETTENVVVIYLTHDVAGVIALAVAEDARRRSARRVHAFVVGANYRRVLGLRLGTRFAAALYDLLRATASRSSCSRRRSARGVDEVLGEDGPPPHLQKRPGRRGQAAARAFDKKDIAIVFEETGEDINQRARARAAAGDHGSASARGDPLHLREPRAAADILALVGVKAVPTLAAFGPAPLPTEALASEVLRRAGAQRIRRAPAVVYEPDPLPRPRSRGPAAAAPPEAPPWNFQIVEVNLAPAADGARRFAGRAPDLEQSGAGGAAVPAATPAPAPEAASFEAAAARARPLRGAGDEVRAGLGVFADNAERRGIVVAVVPGDPGDGGDVVTVLFEGDETTVLAHAENLAPAHPPLRARAARPRARGPGARDEAAPADEAALAGEVAAPSSRRLVTAFDEAAGDRAPAAARWLSDALEHIELDGDDGGAAAPSAAARRARGAAPARRGRGRGARARGARAAAHRRRPGRPRRPPRDRASAVTPEAVAAHGDDALRGFQVSARSEGKKEVVLVPIFESPVGGKKYKRLAALARRVDLGDAARRDAFRGTREHFNARVERAGGELFLSREVWAEVQGTVTTVALGIARVDALAGKYPECRQLREVLAVPYTSPADALAAVNGAVRVVVARRVMLLRNSSCQIRTLGVVGVNLSRRTKPFQHIGDAAAQFATEEDAADAFNRYARQPPRCIPNQGDSLLEALQVVAAVYDFGVAQQFLGVTTAPSLNGFVVTLGVPGSRSSNATVRVSSAEAAGVLYTQGKVHLKRLQGEAFTGDRANFGLDADVLPEDAARFLAAIERIFHEADKSGRAAPARDEAAILAELLGGDDDPELPAPPPAPAAAAPPPAAASPPAPERRQRIFRHRKFMFRNNLFTKPVPEEAIGNDDHPFWYLPTCQTVW
ncbi:hypothetical protein SO694_00143024 [Aureococcus anophagefferens]|uniref:Uncharacterized protein n=1 Tax=Aureococcus anophagefferens TaxID=44056 RepID=A0ABR1FPJ9_AURAN